jgi:uncharacterized phage protein gp47/JayE
MAFNRPTLSELVDRIKADLGTRIVGSATVLRRSVIAAISVVMAGAVHLCYGFIEYMTKQMFADTAEDEFLERHASIYGVARNAATFADGPVVFTGTNGTEIPAGTLMQRADGIQYATDAIGTISSGTVTVQVTCLTAGETGNLEAAQAVTLVSPISGVTSEGAVDTDGLTGGADEEDNDGLRERLLAKIQEPPHGGNANDYEQWAKEVNGVTRVWVYPSQYGDGTVGVAFVRDDDTPSIIPSVGEVADVQAYIDVLAPVTADVTVWAPTSQALNLTINLDGVSDTAAVKAAIEAELKDLIRREAEPAGTLLISHIREAISSAAGEDDHVLTTPTTNQTASAGAIFELGTITWT